MSAATVDEGGDDAVPLVLQNVSREFGPITVLDNVSLTVDPGSLVAVIGPNGSGKTTLLRIATGLLAPSTGTINRPSKAARPIGYLPQHPALRAPMTVRETLRFYATLIDSDVAIDPILETIGLESVDDRRIDALSGGMRQLLGLGIAILGDPPLIVLDEPTSGLDPRNTEHIFDVMTDLTDEGTSILLATHELAFADMSDQITVIDDGQVIIQASPAELRERTTEDTLVDVFRSILGSDPTVQTGRDGQ